MPFPFPEGIMALKVININIKYLLIVCEEELPKIVGKIKGTSARLYNSNNAAYEAK